MKARINKR